MAVLTRTAPPAPAADRAPRAAQSPFVAHGRDLRIDFLRGLCVIAMIVDHVAGASWLYAATGGNRFYTSAAEGFVFVSGLIAGRAYTRAIERDGLSVGLSRVIMRAGQLYLLAVALTLIFVPASELLKLPWALGWNLHNSVDFVLSVVTLHRTYYLVDVLLLYVLLLLTAAVIFALLQRGHVLGVLAASWALWFLYQVFPDQTAMPWPIVGNTLFFFPAWQVLFFTGLVIGYRWEQRAAMPADARPDWLARVVETPRVRQRALRVGALLLATTIAVYVFQDRLLGFVVRNSPDAASAQALLVTSLTGKSDLKVGRLAVFALVFVVFFLATTAWWPILRRGLGWFVLPLGQNALYAYSAHVLIALGVAYELQHRYGSVNAVSPRANAAVQVGSMLAVWALVQIRPPRAVFRARRVWLAPAAIGLATLLLLPRIAPDTGQTLAPARAAGAATSATTTAANQVARAFGTAIPPGVEPTLSAAASAPPIQQEAPVQQQPAASDQPSNAAGTLQGTLYEPELASPALNARERYFIYLPPNAQTSGKRYPVLYMLHGGGGHAEWVGYGLVSMADGLISAGKLPPLIIVLPQGDSGYWVNHQDGGPRWGDYLVQDVVQHIDASYPTLTDAKHRAIGGMSMGGYGALYQAFSHPDEFGVVGAHAASLRGGDGSLSFLPKGSAFSPYDPVEQASHAPGVESLQVWLDADEQDPWVKRDADLHRRLDERHINNEWHTYPGRHGGSYWHDHVQDYLNFYGKALATP